MGLFSRFRRIRGYAVTVELNARLQPMHRGSRFEDPLAAALDGTGSAVTGARTLMERHTYITGCTIDVAIGLEAPDETLEFVIRTLTDLGAPRGSRIGIGDEVREFGGIEGLCVRMPALKVDYKNDEHIPCSHELDAVMARVTQSLAGAGEVWSWRLNGIDSEVYVYGASRTVMRERLELDDAEIFDIA